MKKILSCVLAICMIAAIVAVIPMSASAATVYNTSRYYATNSTTGLDAYAGTPTMGAAAGATTIKDDVWNNAIKMTLNKYTDDLHVGGTTNDSYDADYYMLWDNDNLYILNDVRGVYKPNDGKTDQTTTSTPFPYSGHEVTNFHILLPREFGEGNMTAKSFMIFVLPCLSNATIHGQTDGLQAGDIWEGVVRVRTASYTSATADNGSKVVLPYADTEAAGLETYIEKTEKGYISETKIPWSFLDSTANKEFANATDKQGKTFGVKINYMNGYILNNNGITVDGKAFNNDTAGHDPVTLLPAATQQPKAHDLYATKITADIDYWLNATNGQFVVNDPKVGGKTYEIYTAAQLMGLANILEAGTGDHSLTVLGIESSNKADKALLTRGNTFKLMNDIDLNPGVTNWAEANEFLTNKNANKSADLAKLNTALPQNVFVGFDRFYGILDGQGYAIKGLYNPDAKAVSWRGAGITNATGGLIGQLSQGGLTNLIVESGYVGTSKLEGNVMFGGLIGELRPEAYTDFTNGKIVLTNIYVGPEFTSHRWGTASSSDTNAYAYSGVCSSVWAGGTSVITSKVNIDATFADIVYNGKLLDNPTNISKYSSKLDVVLGNNYKSSGTGTWAANNVTFKYTYGNIVANVPASASDIDVTATRYNKVVDGAGVPEGKEGALVALTDGTVVTARVADMLADTKWQASAAEDGRFYVRFASEVSIADFADYTAIGHVVTITGTKGDEVKTYTVNFSDNDTLYKGVKANGVTVTPDDETFNDIVGNYLVLSMISLPVTEGVTYTASVKTIYKVSETVTIEGCAKDLGVIAPLN